MEGRTIADRYRIDSRIGEGGLATVYRAMDLSLERPVAVKILKPEWSLDPEALVRFRREARAAAKLNHPNIVQVFDTGVDGDVHYLVMEYLPEPDLKQVIAEYAPLPARKVLEVAAQVCQALAYIHGHGLVHGDVKPQNVLFTDQGIAKLSDFGIAAAAGSEADVTSGMVLGTAHYIAPEQAQGKPVGPQSDLYSLGCIIYEAFTGQTPFSGETAAQVAAKHVRQQPPSPRISNPSVSTSEEYLINKAMAKDLGRRYRSADEMGTDLAKLASGQELDRTGVLSVEEQATVAMPPAQAPESVEALPSPAPARRGREAQADATVIWSTVVVIVLALAALVLFGWLLTKAFYPGAPAAEVQVPSVRGLTEAEARQKIVDAKLEVGRIETDRDPDRPVGQVIEQYPPEGESVPLGTTVRFTINLGKELVTAPDVVGMSYRQATVELEKIGLSVGQIEEKYSDEIPEDEVMRQSHAPGTQIEKGWPVDLVVSKGPEPDEPEEPLVPVEPIPPAEGESEGEEPVPSDPHVSIDLDESSVSADGMERDFIVKITVLGQQEDQEIRVMRRDATGGPIIELDGKMQPGQSEERRVHGRGTTTIEVYHNGKLIKQHTFAVAAPESNEGE